MEVRMTMDEYLALVNGNGMEQPAPAEEPMPSQKKRKKTARDRAMKKAIPIANARYKKKNGQFRAGRTQADVMKLANKLADRMMK